MISLQRRYFLRIDIVMGLFLTSIFSYHLISLRFLAWPILQPWRWKWYVFPKHRLTFNELYCDVSQKTDIFMPNSSISLVMASVRQCRNVTGRVQVLEPGAPLPAVSSHCGHPGVSSSFSRRQVIRPGTRVSYQFSSPRCPVFTELHCIPL
jgi:hypothetical protein